MNLRDGTRRLALLLGVVGAFIGGVVSYAQLQSLMRQRAAHRQFEQLANSDLVQEAKRWISLSPGQRDKVLAQMTPEHKSKLAKALGFSSTPEFNPNAPYTAADNDPIAEFMALPEDRQLFRAQSSSPREAGPITGADKAAADSQGRSCAG